MGGSVESELNKRRQAWHAAYLCAEARHDHIIQRAHQALQGGREGTSRANADHRGRCKRPDDVQGMSTQLQTLRINPQNALRTAAAVPCMPLPAPRACLHALGDGRTHIGADDAHQLLAHAQRLSRNLAGGAGGGREQAGRVGWVTPRGQACCASNQNSHGSRGHQHYAHISCCEKLHFSQLASCNNQDCRHALVHLVVALPHGCVHGLGQALRRGLEGGGAVGGHGCTTPGGGWDGGMRSFIGGCLMGVRGGVERWGRTRGGVPASVCSANCTDATRSHHGPGPALARTNPRSPELRNCRACTLLLDPVLDESCRGGSGAQGQHSRASVIVMSRRGA